MGEQGYGRLGVGLVAFFVGLPLLGFLVAVYVDTYGALPFTIAGGPYGLPPWLPFLVLFGAATVVSFTPILLRNFRDRELTFHDQIAINRRNSVLLAAAVAAGLGTAAYAIGTVVTLQTTGGLVAAAAAIGTAVAGAIVSYRAGDRIVLRVGAARPLADGEAPVLRNVVAEMAIAANIPPPALHLVQDTAPNAFAIGRDPAHASLAVTTGLLHALDREELQGVVAHELAHIRNLDSRYALFVAVLVGTTVLIADGFFRVVTFPFRLPVEVMKALSDSDVDEGTRQVSGRGSGGSWSFPRISLPRGSSKGGGAIILAIIIFILLVLLVAAIVYAVAPVFARLTQVAASREREYLADSSAVEICRNPAALERALLRVAVSREVLESANRATAPLYFVHPIRAFEDRASAIWSTHPRTLDRVNRLRRLTGQAPLAERDAELIADDLR